MASPCFHSFSKLLDLPVPRICDELYTVRINRPKIPQSQANLQSSPANQGAEASHTNYGESIGVISRTKLSAYLGKLLPESLGDHDASRMLRRFAMQILLSLINLRQGKSSWPACQCV